MYIYDILCDLIHLHLCIHTGAEDDDGLHTAVLGRVHVQRLQFLHLFLEDPDVVHEGDDPVRRHGGGVQPRGGEEGGDVEGHGALGGVEHEQLRPAQPQHGHLVCHLNVGSRQRVN